MKKKNILYVLALCVALVMAFALTGCGTSEEAAEQAEEAAEVVEEQAEEQVVAFKDADVPEAVMALIDEVKGIAQKYADQLTPEFGDQYVALIESGEGRDYKDYEAMKA